MLLTVNYTSVKPHISELAQVIAKDLDVNTSQVQLMNLTSKENTTLLRWAIFPAQADDYIANATAMNIISILSGNKLRLPDSFGSYKIFEWRLEPPPQRTWWQQHYLALVVASILLIVIGVLAVGAWLTWKKSRSEVPYKPVGSVVAEYELQPLQN